MSSHFSLFCLMLLAIGMMSTVTLPVAAHRLLKLSNPTLPKLLDPNHLPQEILPTILLPRLTTPTVSELPKPTLPKLRKPKRSLLQIDIHPTVGAVPITVGSLPLLGGLPITPP
ncbi:hypothetical protein BVRB_9g212670 [Beta vulgaris subsp. vulgaris]|nr:hypothetical protein BVRB_9g212670 [Beta vulgaris subsp. vulgaris]